MALEEDDLEFLEFIQEYLGDVVIQYETMMDSAREEMRMMINNYNALSISRIGFVATEMMDIRNTVSSSIQQRALEINSTTAGCIVDAISELEYVVAYAGPSFAEVSGQINFEIIDLGDFYFFPLMDDLHEMVSSYETDLLMLIGIYNPVEDIEYMLFNFFIDVLIYDIFFEYFIDDIYIEMVYWNLIMEDVSSDNFPILQSSLDYFRFNANLIQNTLNDCNPDEIEV